jgi:hypothetical protein
MESHQIQAARVTRKSLVAWTVGALLLAGLTLAAMYFLLPPLSGRPVKRAGLWLCLTAIPMAGALGVATYRNFKRYWPADSAPPPRLDRRALRTALTLSLIAALGSLASFYLFVHHALYPGMAAAFATVLVGRAVIRRLRGVARG